MNKNSIFYRMTSFVIILIIIQSMFFIGMMILGGVLEQAEDNAFQTFSDKVKNRNTYIQSQMKNNWTNMGAYYEQISRMLVQYEEDDEFFTDIMPTLIAMLRNTETTGAYVILSGEELNSSAVYVRDYDPLLNDSSNKDLYMVYGDSKIASEMGIPLDQTWSYRFIRSDENMDFIEKPISMADLSSRAELMGYWSLPFKLTPKDTQIMTYSMPLFDANNELRGVIGVEISTNYFKKLLPSKDLRPTNSLGYLLAYREKDTAGLQPVVMTGALQQRTVSSDELIKLHRIDEERKIYTIENANSKEAIYSVVERIGVYNVNTPFENESWYLIGMLQEGYLLNYVKRIQEILLVALVTTLVLGIIGGYILSYRFTKPIRRLVKQVKESDKMKALELDRTGLLEIDALSEAMVSSNHEMLESTIKMSQIINLSGFSVGAFEAKEDSMQVLMTDQLGKILDLNEDELECMQKDKALFLNRIEEHFSTKVDEEDDVFPSLKHPDQYLRIRLVRNQNSIMGVVIDVSKEIHEKQRIRKERDYDPLTKIYNRNAVARLIEEDLRDSVLLGTSAFLMFDLDYLKMINDTYGHQWGDIYIIKAVEALSKINRDHSVLGRRSGDEFILFLYGYPNQDELLKELDRFYRDLEKNPIELPDGSYKTITISGGLAWIEDVSLGYDFYMHKADEQLYKAKFNRKGTYYSE